MLINLNRKSLKINPAVNLNKDLKDNQISNKTNSNQEEVSETIKEEDSKETLTKEINKDFNY